MKEKVAKTAKNINVFQTVGMDQREEGSVVLFLRLKALLKKAIHDELVAVFQENAASYLCLTRFYREAILGLNSEDASASPKDDGLDEVNEAILLGLSDETFSPVRQIVRMICVPKNIVYRWPVNSLHFAIRHQTSSLGSSQTLRQSEGKSNRVELSIQLYGLMPSIRHQG
jgi:hypothetical protein